ncbi:hypothetical protein ABZU45_39665 [Streptomyces avermitilis]|uniref:hypothetical protein n=1 Tax=Streptomyces avermitilis TaxID=33903 RepID=UPI0033B396CC
MDTATLLLLGAAGGAVRGIVHAYDCMTEWLSGRRQHRLTPDPPAEGPPAFSTFYDVGGESIAAVVHTVLGAAVAVLLGTSGQVSGGFAVFAAGASAPLVLVQLKNSRLAEVILGDPMPRQPPRSRRVGPALVRCRTARVRFWRRSAQPAADR